MPIHRAFGTFYRYLILEIMNYFLFAANILAVLAFFVHTFQGDKEIRLLELTNDDINLQEKWTMIRCGWHWISFDLLMLSALLGIINFSDWLKGEATILYLLSIYCLGYAIFWIISILISKPFKGRFLSLGQWGLLLLIGGLIYFGV